MLPKLWHNFSLLLLVNTVFGSSLPFENGNIVRTIELGGSVVHVTTGYSITPLQNGLKSYTIALGHEEREKTSWLEVRLKGEKAALTVKELPFNSDRYVILDPVLGIQPLDAFNHAGITIFSTLSCHLPPLLMNRLILSSRPCKPTRHNHGLRLRHKMTIRL